MTGISQRTGMADRIAKTAWGLGNSKAKRKTDDGNQARKALDPIKTALTGTETHIDGNKMGYILTHSEGTKVHPHTDIQADANPTNKAGRHHGTEMADKTGIRIIEPEMKAKPTPTGDDPPVAMHLRGTETPGPGTKKEIEEGHQEHGTATNHETGETGIMDHIQEMGQAKATAPTKNPKNTDTETYPQIQVTCSRK